VLGTCFISLSVNRYLGTTQLGGGGYSHTVVLYFFYLSYSYLFLKKKQQQKEIYYLCIPKNEKTKTTR